MAKQKAQPTVWAFDHVCPHCRLYYDFVNGPSIPGIKTLSSGSVADPVVATLGTEEIVLEQVCTACQVETAGKYAVRIKAWNSPRRGYVLSIAKTEKRY